MTAPAATRDDVLGPAGDPAWAAACAEAFELDRRTFAVDGARADFALVHGRLELLGPRQTFEPGDVRARDAPSLEQLVARLAATRLPLALHRVPDGSPTIAALHARLPLVLERTSGACPVVRLDGEPEATLSARRRSDLRRAHRRAEAHGSVAAQMHEPGPDEADRLLDAAFAIEARGWKSRTGTALALDARRARFYRLYGRAAAAAGELRVAFLAVGGQHVAMQVAVERDGALWLLKIGYDERLAAASPGQLLLRATLGWACDRGLQRVELLGAAAQWTRAWTREERPCSAVFAYPGNPRGAVVLGADGTRHLVRRAVRWARAR